jgi:aminopeptidase N
MAAFGGGGDTQVLTVPLRRRLGKGESHKLTVHVSAAKYDFRIEDSPVAGYHMLGQVATDSSYSSHVRYYPVDGENRARATIRFHVPNGYVAVGPGKLTSQRRTRKGTVFTWTAADRLVKQLPYGWAVARYELEQRRSRGRVPIQVYALPGRSKQAKRVLKVAVDVVNFYEGRFGPFPFGGVSIADVQPVKGIAGVSLPSMVLLSQHFFDGADSYDVIRDVNSSSEGPLVIADELSHQYNFYSVALPNQLAEGMAQYTDSIFAEQVAKADMAEHFTHYSRIYREAVATSPDHPILSDAVYKTDAYMAIVFSKGACVLHMLRTRIGDDAFFASLRQLFSDYRGKRAGVDELQAIAESHSRTKLGWLFDQWYRRSGYPKLELAWRQKGGAVELTVRQTQKGKPFRLPVTLTLRGEGKREDITIELEAAEQRFSLKTAAKVDTIELSKSHPVLAQIVAAKPARGAVK